MAGGNEGATTLFPDAVFSLPRPYARVCRPSPATYRTIRRNRYLPGRRRPGRPDESYLGSVGWCAECFDRRVSPNISLRVSMHCVGLRQPIWRNNNQNLCQALFRSPGHRKTALNLRPQGIPGNSAQTEGVPAVTIGDTPPLPTSLAPSAKCQLMYCIQCKKNVSTPLPHD